MGEEFDLLAPGVIQDPQPTFAKMRRDAPVHWNESVKGWFVTRYFDVRTVMRDRRFSVEKMSPFADQATGSKQQQIAFLAEILGGWMVFKDPPAHTRLRQVLQGAFMPKPTWPRCGPRSKQSRRGSWTVSATVRRSTC